MAAAEEAPVVQRLAELGIDYERHEHPPVATVEATKRVDLRALADQIGDGKLSFASPERLMTHLGLTPGSVSPFGLINDRAHAVRVVLDRDLKQASRLSVHPNINTAT